MRTSRLEAFSDGVLAIIITIMVLELHEPDGQPTWRPCGTRPAPACSATCSASSTSASTGPTTTTCSSSPRGSPAAILWANLALLFSLSLFPFTTQWMDTTHFARTPVVVYGVNLLAAGVAYYVLQWVIIRSQGHDSALRKAIGSDFKGKMSPVGYIAGCVAALLGGAGTGWNRPGIWVAVACYVAVGRHVGHPRPPDRNDRHRGPSQDPEEQP